ncbi:MAG: acetyl-CoA carboxylase biotin carboxyl carrier protein subunit [Bacteroidetes bacterium]|nr:MAG: acetyl-CoA carboxylase biotin carboxyl carrier protein subunit [Bacteroidota bacterium]
MSTEININDRSALVEVLSREGDKVRIKIDGKKYDADVVMVEEGVYSIIIDNKSHNIELISTDRKKYMVNTYSKSYNVEIVDAESKYLQSRRRDDGHEEAVISSPMPGKIVKILVKVGDEVKAGDTVIIVSAMKMESEYKVKKDRIIKEIKVKEGDTVQSNQPLVVIE